MVLFEQPCHQQRGGRSVIRALYDSRVDESLLHYRKMHRVAQGIRRDDIAALSFSRQNKVGEYRDVVHYDCIASAETFGVIAVADGKVAVHQQHVAQSFGRVDIE